MDGTTAATHAVAKTLFLDIVQSLVAAGISAAEIPAKIEGVAFGPDVKERSTSYHTLWIAKITTFWRRYRTRTATCSPILISSLCSDSPMPTSAARLSCRSSSASKAGRGKSQGEKGHGCRPCPFVCTHRLNDVGSASTTISVAIPAGPPPTRLAPGTPEQHPLTRQPPPIGVPTIAAPTFYITGRQPLRPGSHPARDR